MVRYTGFLAFIIVVLGSNFGKCAEFVPVYMWGTTKMPEQVPALHKISEDSFKDTLLEYLKNDPYIVVFAEQTLSPEDFAQRDQNGEIAFSNILDLKKSQTHVTYRPYVQNPIGAVKQLDRKVTELSIASLLNSPDVPKDNILVIDLNDAKDDEQRFQMLKRHDSDIVSIYKDFLEQHENVLAIYTAHHTSWVAPEEVTHKKSRHLLAADTAATNGSLFVKSPILLYLSADGKFNGEKESTNISKTDFTADVTSTSNTTTLILTNNKSGQGKVKTIDFVFTTSLGGYWYVESVSVSVVGSDKDVTLKVPDVYAPVKFSYHCGDLVLREKGTNQSLVLPGFQIQYFDANSTSKVLNETFGDAYDCVGFTSVPIWSSLFVAAILLLIMTFGLTMMMDIKTMDRFDDAKGKTIVINASE